MLVASLPFEEQVFMKEGLRPIGEIVEENFKKYQNEIKIHGVQTILNTKNKEIFCYSYDKKTKRVRLKKVTALLRHKPVDKIFELTLENGRKCRVTESHSVFSDIDKPIEVKNLQEGDSIVVPRKIEFPYKKKKNIFDVASLRQKYSTKPILFNEKKVWTYLSPINCRLNRYINMNSPELAWLIGFWIAEGSFSSGTNNKNADRDLIFFSNKDKKKILKIKNIIKKIFGCDCYIANDKRNGVLNLAIGTKILGILFREWGLTKNCYQKEIPSFVFNSNKKFIESLIDGMFAGDGCKCKQVYKRKDGTIKSYDKSYYATISKTLANQLSYLFLTLGIKCGIYYIAGKKEALRKQKDGSFTHYRRKGIYHIEILKREKTDSSMKKIKIIKKKEINYKGYVYDFEVCDDFRTDNFIGGFGGVMLHNTMNPAESGYEGRRPLDAGLKDRFHIKLFYDYDEAIENKLVKSKKILELARKLRFMRGKGELSTPVSLRMLLYYDNNSELFGEKVAFDMFLNSFESHEREPIRNVLEMIEKPVKVEAEPPTVLTGSNKVVTP
jgi:intein/homing endonuclease